MKTKALAAGAALLLLALTGCSGGAAAASATPTATATASAMPAGTMVPDVTGRSLDDAVAKLKAAGISFDILPQGSAAPIAYSPNTGLTVIRTYPEKRDPLPSAHMTLYVDDVAASASARAAEIAAESAAPAASASPWAAPLYTATPTPTSEDSWTYKPPSSDVVYTVTSDGPISQVTVGNTIRGKVGMEQFTDQPAKFTKSYHFDEDISKKDFDFLSVDAQAGGGSTITCAISVNGYEVARQTSSGAYAMVMCSN